MTPNIFQGFSIRIGILKNDFFMEVLHINPQTDERYEPFKYLSPGNSSVRNLVNALCHLYPLFTYMYYFPKECKLMKG